MHAVALAIGLALSLFMVLSPAVIAGLALQRFMASRSRNRALYGLAATVSGGVAIRTLADIISGTPANPLVALAALAAPVGWGLILRVVYSPERGQYADQRYMQAAGDQPRRQEEAVRVTRQSSGARSGAAKSAVAFGSRKAEEPGWRPASPLPFVPGIGGR